MTLKQVVAAKVNELQEGEMKQVSVDNGQILLAKINDRFYATTAFCTHAGAPLEQGVLNRERVVCPWHNACFNIVTGEIQEPPGRNSLVSFDVKVEGDEVIVELPEERRSRRSRDPIEPS